MFLRRFKQPISKTSTVPNYAFCSNKASKNRLQTFLSEDQAHARRNAFAKDHQLSYDVVLKVMKGDAYEGRVDINFGINQLSKNIFLDYAGLGISKLTVNNNTIDAKDNFEYLRKGRFLTIPDDALQKGDNKVSITFSNNYTKDGNGLHTFVDTDARQYIYSNLEPYHCNKMFPVFDQPDLKGKFKLSVLAPQEWTVISNEMLDEKANPKIGQEFLKPEDKDFKLWSFRQTPALSTYLYAIIAGPYMEVKNKNPYNNIPMSLYSRESLFPHLERQAEELFEITIESMKFFEKFFNYPFPFSKYDQIFCPEYNIGAMENPGAVTFNDRYLFKEEVTRRMKTQRANTIAHELSHMWFGDLVTMKWWNDLWLNESFADFISHFCLANVNLKHTKMEDIWHIFFQGKGWAYREDQLATTHPIATEVPNTEQAENIFDGITYAKGAATMKQLLCLIGENSFSKGVSGYFKEFEWNNATLDDFIKHLQSTYTPNNPMYPADLNIWKHDWLKKAGLNEATPSWDPKTNKITIHQGVALPEHPTLRFHKLKLALFDENGKIYRVEDLVIKNEKETVYEIKNLEKQPSAILLNYLDEAYIKVRLDPTSISFFKKNLKNIEEELTRAIIWRALWDMTRDAQISSIDWIDAVCANISSEVQDNILTILLAYSKQAIADFTPAKLRPYLYHKMFDKVLKLLQATDVSNKNRVLLLKSELPKFAHDDSHKRILYNWFDKKSPELEKFEPGIADRWDIVRLAFRDKTIERSLQEDLYNKAAAVDSTDTKTYVRRYGDAVLVNKEEREALWKTFFDPDIKESNHLIAEIMRGFNDEGHLEELESYYGEFWKRLPEVFKTRSREYSRAFFNSLFPCGDNLEEQLANVQNLLKECPEDQLTFKKLLQQKGDDLQRRLRTYNKLISSLREEQK